MDNSESKHPTVEAEEEEQFREYRSLRSSYWVPNRHPSDLLEFDRTATKWRLGKIFAERVFHDFDDEYNADLSEVSATCLATQVEGPNIGMQAILKIRKQIPTDVEIPSDVYSSDIARTKISKFGLWAGFEYHMLKYLTEQECSCTPKLLDIRLWPQSQDDYVPGGFLLYTLMEKVPGRNLFNFPNLSMPERDQVRLAFAKSIREFYSLRCRHGDADRRNLIWDPEGNKCYIIDLEDAYTIEPNQKPAKFRPAIDWGDWGLAGPSVVARDGIDPMVPRVKESPIDPSDDDILKMMADAAGKELYNPFDP